MSKQNELAVMTGGPLQAELLNALAQGDTGAHWPVGCFISLARRGFIDAKDMVTEAGRAAVARFGDTP